VRFQDEHMQVKPNFSHFSITTQKQEKFEAKDRYQFYITILTTNSTYAI
jgi:hypothetical protein